jgi:hypothetical protein
MMATRIAEACAATGTRFIFKASYDKANRSSIGTERGDRDRQGACRSCPTSGPNSACPVLTDVHEAGQCAAAAQAVDVMQIPAFLCRQTDLLLAAGETGAAINIKKGQFLAPWDMGNVAAKVASTGNTRILLCDRGTSFGYNTLVSDFRGLPIMAADGLSGGLRCDPFGAAARRDGHHLWRAARVRAGAGAGGLCGGGERALHRNPRKPGHGPQRRAEHDPGRPDGGADRDAQGLRRSGEVGRSGVTLPLLTTLPFHSVQSCPALPILRGQWSDRRIGRYCIVYALIFEWNWTHG